MGHVWTTALGLHVLVVIVCVATILRRRLEPTAMVSWLLAVAVLPGLGALAYWMLGSHRLRRKARRRRRRVAHLVAQLRERNLVAHDTNESVSLPPDLQAVAQLGSRLTGLPATAANTVTILRDADQTFASLEEAIRAAQHHIHLEYYIWQPDKTGAHFRDLIVARAREGVECRVLLDAVGCRRISAAFLEPLLAAKARVAFYLPLYPLRLRRQWSVHLRNHRKIVVIDGRTAFVGSQNIGDEYRGRWHDSRWYDCHLRVRGPATALLQQTFAEDWYFATREPLDHDAYYPPPECGGGSTLQILPTGPDQGTSVLTQILFAAVSTASASIRIATPYFVPDAAIRMALTHACCRGVQVRLVLPTRSDSRLALWAARSFYAELIDAGVEIHEYDGGVLHAKLVTVDDRWALVGSANMDVRSFRLNFEVTALVYDVAHVTKLAAWIDSFCASGRRITPHLAWNKSIVRHWGEGVARLFAPLL